MSETPSFLKTRITYIIKYHILYEDVRTYLHGQEMVVNLFRFSGTPENRQSKSKLEALGKLTITDQAGDH